MNLPKNQYLKHSGENSIRLIKMISIPGIDSSRWFRNLCLSDVKGKVCNRRKLNYTSTHLNVTSLRRAKLHLFSTFIGIRLFLVSSWISVKNSKNFQNPIQALICKHEVQTSKLYFLTWCNHIIWKKSRTANTELLLYLIPDCQQGITKTFIGKHSYCVNSNYRLKILLCGLVWS